MRTLLLGIDGADDEAEPGREVALGVDADDAHDAALARQADRHLERAWVPDGVDGKAPYQKLADLKERLGKVTDLERISRVLSWDQQTMMPPRLATSHREGTRRAPAVTDSRRASAAAGRR